MRSCGVKRWIEVRMKWRKEVITEKLEGRRLRKGAQGRRE